MNNKILYWPGMGQNLDILKYFRNELILNGYEINTITFKYDYDRLNPKNWNEIINNQANWWIGISLGASLLYYSYNFVKITNRPLRISMINPFSSREKLSSEKGFDLFNQWNFSPKNEKCNINEIDLVSSLYDSKIPMYHGIELWNNTVSKHKNLIFVSEEHTITSIDVQKELANVLLNIDGGKVSEKYNYCNIYKQ